MVGISIFIGISAGLLSGLLGIGGGAVIVPAVIYFMKLPQHFAQGISIAFAWPTAIAGVINLHRKKLIEYPLAIFLSVGSVCGVVLGANLANVLPELFLKKFFAIFFLFVSLQLFWKSRPVAKNSKRL